MMAEIADIDAAKAELHKYSILSKIGREWPPQSASHAYHARLCNQKYRLGKAFKRGLSDMDSEGSHWGALIM